MAFFLLNHTIKVCIKYLQTGCNLALRILISAYDIIILSFIVLLKHLHKKQSRGLNLVVQLCVLVPSVLFCIVFYICYIATGPYYVCVNLVYANYLSAFLCSCLIRILT